MIRAAAGSSRAPDPQQAVREAGEAAMAQIGVSRADAALVFASGYRRGLPKLAAETVDLLGTRAVAGSSAYGVLAGAEETQGGPAVSILVLAGIDVEPFLLGDLAGCEESVGPEIEARLARSAVERDLVVCLLDPVALDAARLVEGLAETLPPAALVGAASAPIEASTANGQGMQWCGSELAHAGVAGLVLRGAQAPRLAVSQGCRPITAPLVATRVEGHWIVELDGRPALEVYRQVAREPLAENLRHASRHLLVAVPRRAAPGREDFVARNVSGFDEERGAFAVAEAVRSGATIRLALRDAQLAREDLKRELEGLSGGTLAFGLYLSCAGRGAALFGHAGLETAYVERALAPAPLAGMFGAFQLGPLAGRPELLTYAGVLAMMPRA